MGANNRLVVVGTSKGDVLAFSAEDGKPVWQAKVTSEVLAAPTVGDQGVAVKSGDNRVFLLDASDGGRKWVYQRSTPPLSIRSAGSPVFADQYIFVGFPGGKLVALSIQNGGEFSGVLAAARPGDQVVIRGGDWSDTSGVDSTWVRFLTLKGSPPTGAAGTGWIHFTAYPGPVLGNTIEDVHYSTPAGVAGGIAGPPSARAGRP